MTRTLTWTSPSGRVKTSEIGESSWQRGDRRRHDKRYRLRHYQAVRSASLRGFETFCREQRERLARLLQDKAYDWDTVYVSKRDIKRIGDVERRGTV